MRGFRAVFLGRLLLLGVLGCPGVLGVPGCSGEPVAPAAPAASVPRSDAGAVVTVSTVETDGPLVFGRVELANALADVNSVAHVDVLTVQNLAAARWLAAGGALLDPRPGSFVVLRSGDGAVVVGSDAAGAMYGALDLAERVRLEGASVLPLAMDYGRAPAVPIRAANLFLLLPAPGDARWWFRDAGFWQEYLDLMARSRMNFLDLHGMYNPGNTIFPNALLYFARSPSLPDVGAPAADREANIAMLDTVIEMARARGIRVGLMTYRSDTSLTGDPGPEALDEASLRTYVREAAEDLARRAPGLWRIGFRIAESGHDAGWYQGTLIAGVRAAGTGVGVYTRTWGATRRDILGIVQAAQGTDPPPQRGDEMVVEAKFNGEQLGAPYLIAGGAFVQQNWMHYSYQDYLQALMPYQFVFQVRAGGTHRIFRHASFERARRAVASFTLGGARGFTLEGAHAYFPQRDYYHAVAADRFSDWTFRRDEMQYLLYGRLAYDPGTPETVFRAAFARRVGTDGLWDAVQAASDIVPWIQTAHTCGPDHRSYAPELEWGGPVGYWATPSRTAPWPRTCDGPYHGPFDSFAVASPYDTAQDLIAARGTSRLSPVEVARRVLEDSVRARAAADVVVAQDNPEARDVARECIALADLGTYFGHKLRAATALAVYEGTASDDYLAAARAEVSAADDAWRALAADTSYILPFEDSLRMRLLGDGFFHWRNEARQLPGDGRSIDAAQAAVTSAPPGFQGTLPPAADWLGATRGEGPGLAALDVTPLDGVPGWQVSVTLRRPVPKGAVVRVLWKTFSGFTDWQPAPTTGAGTQFTVSIPAAGGYSPGDGGFFAVEIVGGAGVGWRYPDVLQETPYRAVAPRPN